MAAPKDNKYNQVWTHKDAKERFLKALKYSEIDDDCLHLADAIKVTGIPYSTYDYLAEKHKDLGLIKKDTKMEVLIRINKGTIKGDYPPAAGIWRMKQLGETDRQEINQNVTNNELTVTVKRMDK